MCGDTYCPSCGPAQGNFKCPHCGCWSADGGCPDPAACVQAEEDCCAAQEREYLCNKMLEKEATRQGKWVGDIDLPNEVYKGWCEMPIEDLRKLAE